MWPFIALYDMQHGYIMLPVGAIFMDIVVTSHEHHDALNHRQLDCSFNGVFITEPLWRETTSAI